MHLGHVLTENVYEFNISKCIEDFNRQCNMFLADFKHVNSQVRNNLFQKYCTSFYGTQILPLFDVNIQSLYTAWRIAIRRVWRIPWTTHNNMLAHIAGVMDPEYWFAKRCIRFIKMAYTSNNNTVRTISKMGQQSSYSIMGANYKYLRNMYDMSESKVHGKWKWVCDSSAELISICIQVNELTSMRDRCLNGFLSRGECKEIIEFLCTS